MISSNRSTETTTPHVVAVIAVHNRINLTKRCLTSLKKAACQTKLSTIVIDDGSTDGTPDIIKSEFPDVVVINGDGNLWFGGATQLGISKALELQPDYILTLNNDTFPHPDSIDNMVMWSHNKTRVVTSTFFVEDQNKISTAGFVWRFKKGLVGLCHTEDWEKIQLTTCEPVYSVDSVATTFTLYPANSLKDYRKINISRHPHNRYDVFLSLISKKCNCKMIASIAPIATHILGTQARHKSRRKMCFSEFISDTWSSPRSVNYFPGCVELCYRCAPNLLMGSTSALTYIGIYIGLSVITIKNSIFKINHSLE